MWSSTCKSILTYGSDALYLKNSDVRDLDKIQRKLIESVVRIGVRYITNPLLQALKIYIYIYIYICISATIDLSTIFISYHDESQ